MKRMYSQANLFIFCNTFFSCLQTPQMKVGAEQESRLHINFFELKAVLLALKKFEQQCWRQISLVATENTTVVSYINKEGGDKIRLSLCPPLETAFLVQSQADSAKGQAHSRPPECNTRQIAQKQTSNSDRVVSPTAGVRPLVCKMAHSTGGSVCHQVQQQASLVCVPSTGSSGLEGGRTQPQLGGARCLCLVSKLITKILDLGCRRLILIAPRWPNMPWF